MFCLSYPSLKKFSYPKMYLQKNIRYLVLLTRHQDNFFCNMLFPDRGKCHFSPPVTKLFPFWPTLDLSSLVPTKLPALSARTKDVFPSSGENIPAFCNKKICINTVREKTVGVFVFQDVLYFFLAEFSYEFMIQSWQVW